MWPAPLRGRRLAAPARQIESASSSSGRGCCRTRGGARRGDVRSPCHASSSASSRCGPCADHHAGSGTGRVRRARALPGASGGEARRRPSATRRGDGGERARHGARRRDHRHGIASARSRAARSRWQACGVRPRCAPSLRRSRRSRRGCRRRPHAARPVDGSVPPRAGPARSSDLAALLPRAGRRCDVDRATLYAPVPQGRDADAVQALVAVEGSTVLVANAFTGAQRRIDGVDTVILSIGSRSTDAISVRSGIAVRHGTRSAIASHRAASTRPSSRARAWRARSEVRNTVTAARRRSCESPRACAPRPAACRGAGICPSRGRR